MGYGVPFYTVNGWSITGGNGALGDQPSTSNNRGDLITDWRVGTATGVNNNTVQITNGLPAMSATFTASALPGEIASYDVSVSNSVSLVDEPLQMTIKARDLYGNIIPFDESLSVVPVSSHDINTPGLGTLTPNTILFGESESGKGTSTVTVVGHSGIVTISAGYNYTENIKIKVSDPQGNVGYSNSILVVSEFGSCPGVTIDTNQTWNAVDAPGGIFDCRGRGLFKVTGDSTLTLNSYNNGDSNYSNDFGVTLLVDALEVETGSKISSNDLGYSRNTGPSADVHGGYSRNGGTPYGNVYEPVSFGSGGDYEYRGTSGAGGGSIKIVAEGDMLINGVISANGGTGGGTAFDGGAGGSIWLDAVELAGTGVITTNGGNGAGNPGGGGSGGRIAIYYETNNGLDFSSRVQSYGGSSSRGYSAPGTVYFEHKSMDVTNQGTLFIDNNNQVTHSLAAGVPEGEYVFSSIEVKRHGNVEFMGGDGILTITSANSFTGDATKPLVKVSGTLNYTGVGELGLKGVDLSINVTRK